MCTSTHHHEPSTAALSAEVRKLRRVSRCYGVIAVIALLASGGTATWAAATIGSAQVIDNSLRSRDIHNGQVRSPDIAPNAIGDRELAKVPAARVERHSSVAIPTGANGTAIPMLAETFDTQSMWSASDPSSIVIPRSGIYAVSGMGNVSAAIGGSMMTFQIRVLHADASISGFDFEMTNSTSATGTPSSVLKLVAGDKVRLVAMHLTGVNQFVSFAMLSVSWIGPAS